MGNERISITTDDGQSMNAYVAKPESGQGPVVIVIQEIFGINQWVRGIADWLSHEGFIAIAPDLFHRMEPNVELTDQTDEEWKKAFWFYENFDVDQGIKDLDATVKVARSFSGSNAKVGTLGFCLGGKLAFLMAARTDADANVGYYGVQIEKSLDEAVQHPLLLHIAEADPYVNHEAQAQIKSALKDNKNAVIHSYEGMDHAFTRPSGAHYNEAAAKLAHDRSLAFLHQNLK